MDLFFRATHQGATLDPLNVQHAVSIGIHPRSIVEPLSSDPNQAKVIKYHRKLHGKVYEDEKRNNGRYATYIPILLDGGHRYDLMQKRIYVDALDRYYESIEQLDAQHSKHAEKWKSVHDKALSTARAGVWLARVYDMSKV